MIRPELSEAKKYAADGYRMVPVCCEMLSDVIHLSTYSES